MAHTNASPSPFYARLRTRLEETELELGAGLAGLPGQCGLGFSPHHLRVGAKRNESEEGPRCRTAAFWNQTEWAK